VTKVFLHRYIYLYHCRYHSRLLGHQYLEFRLILNLWVSFTFGWYSYFFFFWNSKFDLCSRWTETGETENTNTRCRI